MNFRINSADSFILKQYLKKAGLFVFLHMLIRYIITPFREIEKYIPKTGNVLDFGCGHGFFSFFIYFISKKRKILGLDTDKNKIKIANKVNPADNDIHFLNKQVSSFAKEEFDSVVINDVLYLIPYSEQAVLLKQFHRILKNDGNLIIKTMNPKLKLKFLWNYLQEFLSLKVMKITKNKDRIFYFVKDINNFKKILSNLGFDSREIQLDKGYLHPHILLLCKK